MSKTTALFSGQGSQYPNMGKELYEEFDYVREIYVCAGDILGYDIIKICENEEQLSRTKFSQPAIFALSVAAFTAASKGIERFDPVGAAGHSLGEYAALYASGAFGLEDGFRIIKARAEAMDEAGKIPSAMCAIMGADEYIVSAACEKAGGFVVPVNFNHSGQIVISGEEKPVQKAASLLEEQGAKVIRLNVSGAFHTKLMSEAAEKFKSLIEHIPFSRLKREFYSNLTGERLEIDNYPEYFAQHMISPVLFSKEMSAMAADGVDTCVEFGSGRAVAALAKKNIKSMSVYNVEDVASLMKLKGVFM